MIGWAVMMGLGAWIASMAIRVVVEIVKGVRNELRD